MSTLYRL
jgi:chromosome segregation ATPase